MEAIPYVQGALAAYLLGAIPTGYLVARLFGNVDLLRLGSRKTGATNVLRSLGWKAALIVLAGDLAKGMLAIAAARWIVQGDPVVDLLAGLAAIAGHNYSPYLGFKGGRGVLTGIGTLLIIAPMAVLPALLLGIAAIALTRYVSLGSILGTCAIPPILLISTLALGQPMPHFVYTLLGAVFVVVSHRDNIGRLLHGTERKLGERARP